MGLEDLLTVLPRHNLLMVLEKKKILAVTVFSFIELIRNVCVSSSGINS